MKAFLSLVLCVSPRNICLPSHTLNLKLCAKGCMKLEVNVAHLSGASVVLEYEGTGCKGFNNPVS